ncbi:hypothetical protein [Rothia nasimurium]|uniref:hypothetical protein n=1 Tax=Rothia nasimurium TaxID=85336 RepID=UPI001F267967|nr:hypothetical protein [Rothia nasimurium]
MAQGQLVFLHSDGSEEVLLEAPEEVIATIHNFYELLQPQEALHVNVMETWYKGRTFVLSATDNFRFEFHPYWHETAPLRRDYAEMLRMDLNREFGAKRSISFDTWKHGVWIPYAGPAEDEIDYDRFWGTD